MPGQRRRPFALPGASRVRLRELQQIGLLETGAPLVLTALGGFGAALLVMYLSEIGPDRTAERVEVLAGLAVAVNWTARSSGAAAVQRLARAARAVLAEWRLT